MASHKIGLKLIAHTNRPKAHTDHTWFASTLGIETGLITAAQMHVHEQGQHFDHIQLLMPCVGH